MPRKETALKYLIKSLFIATVYFLAAKFGMYFAVSVNQITAIGPAAGLALAALLLLGEEYWPAILVGAFVAGLTVSEQVFPALGVSIGASMSSLLAVHLLRTSAGFNDSLERMRDVLAFLFFGSLLGPAISASVGLISISWAGLTSWQLFAQNWSTWWFGEMMGVLIITPVILAWTNKKYRQLFRQKPFEVATMVLLIFIVGGLVLSLPSEDTLILSQLKFLIFPFLVWAAVEFSLIGVSTSISLILGIAVLGTLAGKGPFIEDFNSGSSLIFLQIFIFVTTASLMLLASVIEERNRIRLAVMESEERYRQLVELSPDAVYIQSAGRFVFLNTAAVKLFGLRSAEEVLGKSVLDFIHPDFVKVASKRIDLLIRQKKNVPTIEEKILRANGSSVLVEVSSVPFSFKGNPSAQVILHDMTARKLAEQSLRLSMESLSHEKAKAEALLEGLAEAVVAIDNTGRVIYTNKQAEVVFGYPEQEMLGKIFNELVQAEDENGNKIPLEKRPLRQTLLTGRRIFLSDTIIRKDRTKVPVSTKSSPVILDGKVLGAIGTYRDITQDKEIERTKNEFVSLASHQLRSPLTAFKWVLELLKNEKMPKKVKEKIDYLSDSNDRLIILVNDLLSVSRVEAGASVIKKRVSDVKKLITDISNVLRPDAEARKQKIVLDMKIDLVNSVIDPNLFSEAFKNILDNAISYSPAGSSVTVKVEQKGINYVVSVHNEGTVISEKDKASLFTKFYRGSDASVKKPAGSGLGLFIARSSVEANGGKIWFESDVKNGTTFYFTVPITS